MQDKDYLLRSIELALASGKSVRPNPHVGAVIVYQNRIIGEGFHEHFGGPHAEVNAVNSVKEQDRKFLSKSTIYVTLEPCCHTGNTPPCTDLIIEHKIPRVCIAEVDPTEKVKNKGIKRLKDNGVEVEIIDISTNHLTAVFKANILKKRPYIQLKFAKSKDNYIGQKDNQIWLSNETSRIYTHKLRSYTDAILIGTNTAIIDNPSLTLRDYPGSAPQRVILDRTGKIPESHILLSDELPCVIFTEEHRSLPDLKQQIKIDFSSPDFLDNLLKELFNLNIYHLMVEGGATLFKSFVKLNLWDEAHVITTKKMLYSGVKAININGRIRDKYNLDGDELYVIENEKSTDSNLA
jgi:diaminohydroxyphosphoribosylaminopyrimidine deaminase/5-amino-6-(5-phosphoribosylamino)uracil reductase